MASGELQFGFFSGLGSHVACNVLGRRVPTTGPKHAVCWQALSKLADDDLALPEDWTLKAFAVGPCGA